MESACCRVGSQAGTVPLGSRCSSATQPGTHPERSGEPASQANQRNRCSSAFGLQQPPTIRGAATPSVLDNGAWQGNRRVTSLYFGSVGGSLGVLATNRGADGTAIRPITPMQAHARFKARYAASVRPSHCHRAGLLHLWSRHRGLQTLLRWFHQVPALSADPLSPQLGITCRHARGSDQRQGSMHVRCPAPRKQRARPWVRRTEQSSCCSPCY